MCRSPTIRWSSENTTQRSATWSRRREVVRRAHDGLAGPVQLDDEVEQPVLGARIERGGRFVEQEHVGVRDEHRRDRDPLLLAARELVRRPVGELDDVEQREHVVDPLFDLRRRSNPRCSGPNATSSRTVGEKSWASELWKTKPTRDRKRARTVRRRASPRSAPRRIRGRCPASGYDEPGEQLEQRRLPAAVRAEQRDRLAGARSRARRRRARRTGRDSGSGRRRPRTLSGRHDRLPNAVDHDDRDRGDDHQDIGERDPALRSTAVAWPE